MKGQSCILSSLYEILQIRSGMVFNLLKSLNSRTLNHLVYFPSEAGWNSLLIKPFDKPSAYSHSETPEDSVHFLFSCLIKIQRLCLQLVKLEQGVLAVHFHFFKSNLTFLRKINRRWMSRKCHMYAVLTLYLKNWPNKNSWLLSRGHDAFL